MALYKLMGAKTVRHHMNNMIDAIDRATVTAGYARSAAGIYNDRQDSLSASAAARIWLAAFFALKDATVSALLFTQSVNDNRSRPFRSAPITEEEYQHCLSSLASAAIAFKHIAEDFWGKNFELDRNFNYDSADTAADSLQYILIQSGKWLKHFNELTENARPVYQAIQATKAYIREAHALMDHGDFIGAAQSFHEAGKACAATLIAIDDESAASNFTAAALPSAETAAAPSVSTNDGIDPPENPGGGGAAATKTNDSALVPPQLPPQPKVWTSTKQSSADTPNVLSYNGVKSWINLDLCKEIIAAEIEQKIRTNPSTVEMPEPSQFRDDGPDAITVLAGEDRSFIQADRYETFGQGVACSV